MARCMDRCRKGLVSPSSGVHSRVRASGASSRAWYSGCHFTKVAACISSAVCGRPSRSFFHASMKKVRTWSRVGLKMEPDMKTFHHEVTKNTKLHEERPNLLRFSFVHS